MNKYFFAEALTSRPVLWKAMLRSNARPEDSSALSVPEHEAAVLGEDAASLLTWLKEKPSHDTDFSVAEAGFWDYAEESRRLALCDGQQLELLCWFTGITLHAVEIARVISRDELLSLRAELGDMMYLYALRRGQYRLGKVRGLFAALDKEHSLAERCVLHGIMALHLVASQWPEELAVPFRDKLPSLPEGVSLPSFSESDVRDIWFALKKLLLREVAPSWAPCFD